MKKAKSLSVKRFLQVNREEANKKLEELSEDVSFDKTLKEVEENLKRTETENKHLRKDFYKELHNNASLISTTDKVLEGWAPNDLECEKLGILKF